MARTRSDSEPSERGDDPVDECVSCGTRRLRTAVCYDRLGYATPYDDFGYPLCPDCEGARFDPPTQ